MFMKSLSLRAYPPHLAIFLSSAVNWILMPVWFVQIVPGELCRSVKQMAGSARCSTAIRWSLAQRASLDDHQQGYLFLDPLMYSFMRLKMIFGGPNVGASHMKLQTNNALSYYVNNLIALKTQKQTEGEIREQCHSLGDNILCKTIRPSGFISYSGFELCGRNEFLKFKVCLQAITQRVNFRFSQPSWRLGPWTLLAAILIISGELF